SMANTTQFQYPSGNDEQVLKALLQKLTETIPQEDYSMSQYFSPEDCNDYERFNKPMSETVKDFQETGHSLTRIDTNDISLSITPGNDAGLNFRATLYFRNSSDGKETNVVRQYSAQFKKGNGRWQANREDRDLSSLLPGLEAIPHWLLAPPHPLMMGDMPSEL